MRQTIVTHSNSILIVKNMIENEEIRTFFFGRRGLWTMSRALNKIFYSRGLRTPGRLTLALNVRFPMHLLSKTLHVCREMHLMWKTFWACDWMNKMWKRHHIGSSWYLQPLLIQPWPICLFYLSNFGGTGWQKLPVHPNNAKQTQWTGCGSIKKVIGGISPPHSRSRSLSAGH